MLATVPTPVLDDYTLEDAYRREHGRVFLTGTQALVRLLLTQRRLDGAAGLNTAGFVTGYRGSPLGGVDQALWRAGALLEEHAVQFLPAVNEDLAATAVIGSQQVETDPERRVDGVFALWYGKGPGVDRAGDALKHGNAYGSSPHGGVLVVAGDDHGCVSSSMPHQSDVAFMAWLMPVLNPAGIAEYLDFGLFGYALSRYSGMWIGFKAISETVESAASIEIPAAPDLVTPADFTPPRHGLHYRWPDFPGPQIEERLIAKKAAALAFARANHIDRTVFGTRDARFGIVTTGKGHLDLMEALRLLGIDAARAHELGIEVYKIGMVWPLEPGRAMDFVHGKDEILVVEEKRGIIESQLKEYFYDYPGAKPRRMVGKFDEAGNALVPWTGELSPSLLAPIVAARLGRLLPAPDFSEPLRALRDTGVSVRAPDGLRRLPYFCPGCPHNTSTRVPAGSTALAGIGCHFMASWMDRGTESLIQMGGEGVNWVGRARFAGNAHVFQNLGEGTWFHSGSMAIRQAIAAGTNITYKILYNDAVAMTGGQPVDGRISVSGIAGQVRAEGVERIAVVTDEPGRYRKTELPPRASVHHRDELDGVQRELREIPGVTVLIYDQACATEKRRKRKRGLLPAAPGRVYINERVCEGCGDCSTQSNCLAVVPVDTPLGRKRRIDQSACNTDYSCLQGFCPSFVSVEGAVLRKPAIVNDDGEIESRIAALPAPALPVLDTPWNLLVDGVGGTGVVTVGALIAMAAHLEGKGVSQLDFMGFAQKGGAVLSYLRLGANPATLNQVRIDCGMADAVVGCDLVVSTSQKALDVLRFGHTRVLVNLDEIATADFIRDRDAHLDVSARTELLRRAVGAGNVSGVGASGLAERLLGDTMYANVFMLGHAWQQGLVPVSHAALQRAFELNGAAVAANRLAFTWGRLAAATPEFVATIAGPAKTAEPSNLDEVIAGHREFLCAYQDADYADEYAGVVRRARAAERALGQEQRLTRAVADNLFRLMACKDEYEVARLFTDGEFERGLAATFAGPYRLRYHMAPPLLAWRRDATGRPRKLAFGAWLRPWLGLLARGRHLRGTRFDVFGWTAERRMERALLVEYRALIEQALAVLDRGNYTAAIAAAESAAGIRGYGPVKAAAALAWRGALPELRARLEPAERHAAA
ncbi:MAG: indolepyruvate ferredoxin oxidoreductase family protein [Gammaproteobacteria bacterium]|nr:indolepyruvate ferredoxin oxidoreductase family protein [Gammaproteobacteria bacterium]